MAEAIGFFTRRSVIVVVMGIRHREPEKAVHEIIGHLENGALEDAHGIANSLEKKHEREYLNEKVRSWVKLQSRMMGGIPGTLSGIEFLKEQDMVDEEVKDIVAEKAQEWVEKCIERGWGGFARRLINVSGELEKPVDVRGIPEVEKKLHKGLGNMIAENAPSSAKEEMVMLAKICGIEVETKKIPRKGLWTKQADNAKYNEAVKEIKELVKLWKRKDVSSGIIGNPVKKEKTKINE